MSKILAIGLGRMGTALAQTFLKAGHQVTVWNRSAEKATPLVECGAVEAKSVASGIAANDYVVICVGDYEQTKQVMLDCGPLSGKTIIQLTTGSPQEAVAMAKWATEQGALYLGGAIWNYPAQVGTAEGRLGVAGSAAAWESGKELVMCLGEASQYYGEEVATPSALDLAGVLFAGFIQLGAVQAAHVLERAGLDVGQHIDRFLEELPHEAPVRRQLTAVANNDFSNPEAALETWAAIISNLAQDVDTTKPSGALLGGTATLIQSAIDRGYGDQELAAVVKVLRDE